MWLRNQVKVVLTGPDTWLHLVLHESEDLRRGRASVLVMVHLFLLSDTIAIISVWASSRDASKRMRYSVEQDTDCVNEKRQVVAFQSLFYLDAQTATYNGFEAFHSAVTLPLQVIIHCRSCFNARSFATYVHLKSLTSMPTLLAAYHRGNMTVHSALLTKHTHIVLWSVIGSGCLLFSDRLGYPCCRSLVLVAQCPDDVSICEREGSSYTYCSLDDWTLLDDLLDDLLLDRCTELVL